MCELSVACLTIIEQLVPNLLFSLRELQGNRLFSFLRGNFDACDFVRQASGLENRCLPATGQILP